MTSTKNMQRALFGLLLSLALTIGSITHAITAGEIATFEARSDAGTSYE